MSKPKQRINCHCDFCNKTLSLIPSRFQKDEHHFCSRQCYANWRIQQEKSGEIIPCANCGKPTYQEPHRLNMFDNFYCCKQCQKEWRKSNGTFTGSNNPAWRGGYNNYYGPNWSQQQKKARKRDEYHCQICNANRQHNKSQALTVHHIKPFREFNYIPDENDCYKQANDLENLITTCMRCHRGLENGLTIDEAQKLYIKLPYPKIETEDDYECLICHKTFNAQRAVYYHANRVHKIRKDDYIIRFFGQPLCKCGCGNPVKYNTNNKRFPNYINGHNQRGKCHSDATKNKMSKSKLRR